MSKYKENKRTIVYQHYEDSSSFALSLKLMTLFVYAACRHWIYKGKVFIPFPSKTRFYCVTKRAYRHFSDTLVSNTLLVSRYDNLVSILPYHHSAYTQGDYGLWQCSSPCHQQTYENELAVKQMIEQQKDRKIPAELIPYCPVCGKPMTMNLRSDHTFVQDEGWDQADERYQLFIQRHRKSNVMFLELGTGMNTPGIIKYPFWKMVYEWTKAIYACINLDHAYIPKEIEGKSICIADDIFDAISKMQ